MSIGRHTLFNLGGAVFPMVIAIATVPLYLGYIGAERYGVLAVIWAILGYFGFFDLGFGRAVTQRMAHLSDADNSERGSLLWTGLLSTFGLGLAASMFLWLFSDYILLKLIDMSVQSRSEVDGAVSWMLIALPVLLPTTVMIGALQARLRFAEINAIQLICSLISQLLPLAVAASGQIELNILVPAALVSRILLAVLLFLQSLQHVPLCGRPVIDRVHLKAMLSYGGWVSVMTLMGPLLVTVDRLIIAAISGAKAVASYTVPYDLVSRTMVISGSLSSALFPHLASANAVESREMAEQATVVLVAIMTPVVIAGTYLAQPFLDVWLGKSLAASSVSVSELILLGVWFNALAVPQHARLMATGNPRTVALIYLVQIPIYLLTLWLGLRYWGIVGAAIAWTFRVFIDTTLLLYANQALKNTLKVAAPYAIFITAATLSVFLSNGEPWIHWGSAIFLIGLCFVKDRNLLIKSINNFKKSKVW